MQVVKWLIMIFAVSFAMRPLLPTSKLKYADGGFAISFGLGSAISFLTVWFFSAAGVFSFGPAWCILGFLALTGTVYAVSYRKCSRLWFKTAEFKRFLGGFIFFAILFLIAVWVKGFVPEITEQTEQYMDYGYINAIYRQQQVPPEDIWFAGENYNYYYLVFAFAVFLERLSFVPNNYGYNLMICTVIVAFFSMCFSLAEAIINYWMQEHKDARKPYAGVLGGLAAAMMAALSGNGHWVLYGIIAPIVEKLTGNSIMYNKNGSNSYWFPDSTAYIGKYPDTGDYGKHEFPIYTFVIGDYHPHMVNMVFVVALLAVLTDYILIAKDNRKFSREYIKNELLSPHVILLGLLLGLFKGTNYWDFPIYFVVSGAAILFTDIRYRGFSARTVGTVLMKGAWMLVIGFFEMIPFSVCFDKMVSEICIAQNHSQLYKLALLWGFPVMVAVWLIIYLFKGAKWKLKNLSALELATISTALCAIGLLLVPEVIYVKDIYGDSYARYNTMFKFTYQAFILFGILAGVFIGISLAKRRNVRAMILGLVIVLLSGYSVNACKAWFINRRAERVGLETTKYTYALDATGAIGKAIDIVNADDRKVLHVLEGVGSDYSKTNRISAFTGAITVEGWTGHEWLWLGGYTQVGIRVEEVRKFYEDGDPGYCQDFVNKYDIEYIFIGPDECTKYNINEYGFSYLATDNYELNSPQYKLLKVK